MNNYLFLGSDGSCFLQDHLILGVEVDHKFNIFAVLENRPLEKEDSIPIGKHHF